MVLKPPENNNKSYLSETLGSFSPWTSRGSSPKPGEDRATEKTREGSNPSLNQESQRGGDHRISHRHKPSAKNYPSDCPKLEAMWFFASDVAKRKPNYGVRGANDQKPPAIPKKWVAFSVKDSRCLEAAFQELPEEVERPRNADIHHDDIVRVDGEDKHPLSKDLRLDEGTNTNLEDSSNSMLPSKKVPVNEDYLFDVSIEDRELAPAYWLGPVYEVRRGTWFYAEGTSLRPCDENLALQLEEGYLKNCAWSGSSARATPEKANDAEMDQPSAIQTPLLTYRLFGAHMNSIVTYQDGTTAWLMTDDFLSRMSSTVYSRFAGGAHFSGTKIVRGYIDPAKKKDVNDGNRSMSPSAESSSVRRAVSTSRSSAAGNKHTRAASIGSAEFAEKRHSLPPPLSVRPEQAGGYSVDEPEPEGKSASRRSESTVHRLERQMSSLVTSTFVEDPQKQEEEARKLEEQEISDDYKDTPGDEQDREIEHLILITHGIGQRLGARFETFNFIHDVNQLRATLKTVYSSSEDLQALNAEVDKLPKNCRIQVLPICWRHHLDFPMKTVKQNRKEYDIGDADADNEDTYPSLNDITLEGMFPPSYVWYTANFVAGVPAVRNIVADLALDILLYQNDVYKNHISRIVAEECNRIYRLFRQRNPYFNGRISMIGHSLGSAIFFDILSEQSQDRPAFERSLKTSDESRSSHVKLDFDADALVLLGSPIGLFQMLKGKTIAGRTNPNKVTLDGHSDLIDDPFTSSSYTKLASNNTEISTTSAVSAPKCQQLYNIFHPTDPVAYRLEPLITPSMATLYPQPLPYVKRNFFGAPMGQGFTGIPARVGQSVSGFFSTFSSGLADRFIHRSLGITPEDAAKLRAPTQPTQQAPSKASFGAGTNIVSGGVISATLDAGSVIEGKKCSSSSEVSDDLEGQQPPTLLDTELETLYAGFQKRRKTQQSEAGGIESSEWAEAEERGRKLQREEAKVRALNSNGRVDYSIQEGAFDISFLASIASHLAYWTDEDVCHFLIGQLLKSQRIVRRRRRRRS